MNPAISGAGIFAQWKDTYVHAPYVVWTAASKDGVRRFESWDKWSQEVEQLFKNDPKPQDYDGVVLKYNYKFRIYGNGAWVSCEQMNGGTKTLETRVMEKDKGKWKIAMVQVIFNANEPASEGTATNRE
jgi:hypothetical protein